MKKTVLLFALILAGALWAARANSLAYSAEEAAARVPLENYLKGHATGDPEHYKKAFHPEAKLFWFRDGKFGTRTSAEYAWRFTPSLNGPTSPARPRT